MIGSIIGDIAGSCYEFVGNDDKFVKILDTMYPDYYEYTDDTVMSVAVADCILNDADPVNCLQQYARKYPDRGYGWYFSKWINSENPRPYHSYGNGAAMRINPVGFLNYSMDKLIEISDKMTTITHNHPEGIKGAQSVASTMNLMLHHEYNKNDVKKYVTETYGYNLEDTVSNLRLTYSFDETCQNTVPQAFICFLESTDFEDAIRNAISINGDSDTLACIVGGLAECYYKVIPQKWVDFARIRLDLHLLSVINAFENKFGKYY